MTACPVAPVVDVLATPLAKVIGSAVAKLTGAADELVTVGANVPMVLAPPKVRLCDAV